MIKLFLFWIRNLFEKPKPKPGGYIHIVKKFANDRYLCVIDGRVFTISADQYKEYLMRKK